MWSTKVRSGHNISCLCSFVLEVSSCRVTYENCYKSSVVFNQVWGEWMDLRNSNGFELRNSYFTIVQKLFSKIFIKSGKLIIQVLPNQVSKKSFYAFEDTDLWESLAKVHKIPSETLRDDSISGTAERSVGRAGFKNLSSRAAARKIFPQKILKIKYLQEDSLLVSQIG